jgi:hypothetical protein
VNGYGEKMIEISPWMMLFPIAIGVVFVALVSVAVRAEIRTKGEASSYLVTTLAAVAIAGVFYPMTIAPTGAAANGGFLGLTFLLLASALSWWAFARNSKAPWIRRLIQLPVTAMVSFMTIHDAYCQHVGGWWRGF